MKNIILIAIFISPCLTFTNVGWSQEKLGHNQEQESTYIEVFQQVLNPVMDRQQERFFDAWRSKMDRNNAVFVRVNASQLIQSGGGNFNLPGEEKIFLETYTKKDWIGGRVIWKGRSITDATQACLIVNQDLVTGSIHFPGGNYRLYPLSSGLHILLRQDAHTHKVCGTDHTSVKEHFSEAMLKNPIPDDHDYYPAGRIMDGECSIRVLLAYTNAADDASADILSIIRNDVEDFNDTNENSEVDFEVEIACVAKVNYTESETQTYIPVLGTRPTDLIRFWDHDDGFMDEIHELRNQYDADMCQLYTTDAVGAGGVALAIGASDNLAFCMSLWNNGSFTPVHEFGHLIGMRHDTYVDDSDYPFSFGHGYTWTGDGPNFRTIMAYDDACEDAGHNCSRRPSWSNPDVTFAGNATGTASANNARVARAMDEVVSAFQATISHKAIFMDDIIRSNEVANVFAHNSITTNEHNIDYRAGASGDYSASETIILSQGFWARQGSDFSAHLSGPCNSLSSPFSADEEETGLEINKPGKEETVSSQASLKVFPNPFRSTTTINYQIDHPGSVKLAIYNINGNLMQSLIKASHQEAGTYQISFDGSNLPSGIYLAHLITNAGFQTCKMIIE